MPIHTRTMRLLVAITLLSTATFAAILKIYDVTRIKNCAGDQPIQTTLWIGNGTLNPNKVFFSGEMAVRDKVLGPLELSFETNRCDFEMKKCEKFSLIRVGHIWRSFNSLIVTISSTSTGTRNL